jgi:protein phosphatase
MSLAGWSNSSKRIPMNITHYAGTDIGLQREENQDSFATGENPNGLIFIIADGLGHSIGGKFASQTAVDHLLDAYKRRNPVDVNNFLKETLLDINRIVFHEKVKKYNKEMMASTCVVLVIQNNSAHLAHVGDSRAYHWHANKLVQLTKDQSLVQSLIDAGMITPKEAETHLAKNVVTEALGTSGKLKIDILKNPIKISKGDKFLLCTDGLWGMIKNEDFSDILSSRSGQEGIDEFIKIAKKNGGIDNITLQLIQID